MNTMEDLARAYGRNMATLKKHVEGLTHAQTVRQLPFPGNCMNWVLGHIAGSRDQVLKYLGEPPVMTPEQAKRYGYGSAPVCDDGPDVVKLEELLAIIERSQERLAAALTRATVTQMDQPVQSFLGQTTVGNMALVLYGHECAHVGQVEMLRELALA
jgi:hypothetical protein